MTFNRMFNRVLLVSCALGFVVASYGLASAQRQTNGQTTVIPTGSNTTVNARTAPKKVTKGKARVGSTSGDGIVLVNQGNEELIRKQRLRKNVR